MTFVHQRWARLGVACIVTVLALSACSSTKVDSRIKAVRYTKNISLKQSCTPATCSGTRQGGAFTIQLPPAASWNGTLVIWSHGYRPAAAVPANPLAPTTVGQVDRSAQDAPSTAVASALLAKGYALAGSAFATNGWDVLDGVAADKDLYTYFRGTFGTPKRVYVWGDSLGGLITQTLAETNPDWVSGVAPLCGVLGGTNLNLDLALDVAYAVKTLFYPSLQLTGYSSVDDAVTAWEKASQAMIAGLTKGDSADIADMFAIASIAGAPAKTDLFDGSTVQSQVSAIAQAVVVALGYGTWGRFDLEQRVGGNPSQNVGVDYAARISAGARAVIGSELSRITTALANGQRVTADAGARAKAATLGAPTGELQRPTITLHTEFDPLVLVQNEGVFADRVSKHSAAGQLVQLYTGPPAKYTAAPYGAGHCNFTTTEYVGVLSLLDGWVRYGVYAGPGAVANAFNYSVANTAQNKNTPATIAGGTASTGYDPNYSPSAWPAAPTS